MRKIQEKYTLALSFSIFVFLVLSIIFGLFFLLYQSISAKQLKSDFVREMGEIISNHLTFENNVIEFIRDNKGGSLREYLITENMSAVFLDDKGSLVRRYGLFALESKSEEEILFPKIISSFTGNQNTYEETVMWNSQSMRVFAVPLRAHDQTLGYMILGRSLTDFFSFSNTVFLLFISLLFINLFASFVVGYFLAKKVLNPLRSIVKTVSKIDLDHIDARVFVDGHPKDEIVLLSQDINHMLSRLEETSEKQRAFIANASHELKTPLTRVISTLQVLHPGSADLEKKLHHMTDELFLLNGLLDQLLLLSKMQKTTLSQLKTRQMHVALVIKNICESFSQEIEEKKLLVDIKVLDVVGLKIPKAYFIVLLSNLIANAVKYNRVNGKIFITGKETKDAFILVVTDNGVGMKQEEAGHMFDQFYRGKKEVKAKGYGIGLYIVKQICEQFYIKINVRSKEGVGTSIELTFPL